MKFPFGFRLILISNQKKELLPHLPHLPRKKSQPLLPSLFSAPWTGLFFPCNNEASSPSHTSHAWRFKWSQGVEMLWRKLKVWIICATLPETHSSPLQKKCIPKGHVLFQPLIFRGKLAVSFTEGRHPCYFFGGGRWRLRYVSILTKLGGGSWQEWSFLMELNNCQQKLKQENEENMIKLLLYSEMVLY